MVQIQTNCSLHLHSDETNSSYSPVSQAIVAVELMWGHNWRYGNYWRGSSYNQLSLTMWLQLEGELQLNGRFLIEEIRFIGLTC